MRQIFEFESHDEILQYVKNTEFKTFCELAANEINLVDIVVKSANWYNPDVKPFVFRSDREKEHTIYMLRNLAILLKDVPVKPIDMDISFPFVVGR